MHRHTTLECGAGCVLGVRPYPAHPNNPHHPNLSCCWAILAPAHCLQVWNVNATTGVVGVFNLQGSSWDRSRRRFQIHNSAPPELSSEWQAGGVLGNGGHVRS